LRGGRVTHVLQVDYADNIEGTKKRRIAACAASNVMFTLYCTDSG